MAREEDRELKTGALLLELDAAAPEILEDPQPGASDDPRWIGRYELRGRLGAGGMGVVHRGYDPRLHREVAIKLLSSGELQSDAQRQRSNARMLREAQAMARLSHPNVVAVHDVGTLKVQVHGRLEERIFITMELVRGPTLRDWLEMNTDWQTILATFIQAGHGLKAAHDRKLVHRDFKPDNVLIGEHGAQVTDFGLVNDFTEEWSSVDVLGQTDSDVGCCTTLTSKASFLGTRRYAAPEQLQTAAVDARADQYSFCVALHEALYRCLPADDASDDLREPGPGPQVPRALWSIVARGLRSEPGARWPTMAALLAALGEAGACAARESRQDSAGLAPTALAGSAHDRRRTRPDARSRRASTAPVILGGLLAAVVVRSEFTMTGGTCSIVVEPDLDRFTPAFDTQPRCSCTSDAPACHQLYLGRVLAINGIRAFFEFKKVYGGPPSKTVRYWVLGGAVTPDCTRLDEYPEFADGYWLPDMDLLRVENVAIWPSQAAFDAAPPGSTRTLFLATGDGAGDVDRRTWFQQQAIVFEKRCG